MNVGERILYLLELHDMKQVDLARRLNLHKATISQYINGDRMPNAETLFRLADVFGVTVDYLLGRTDDPRFEDDMPEEARVLFRRWGTLAPADRQQVVNLVKWLHAKIDNDIEKGK